MTALPSGAGVPPRKVVALSGGVGGARLAQGLHRVLPPGALTVIVNTGDDFNHWGLEISPDVDTVMYHLAGICDDDRGWGLERETFRTLAAVRALGGPAWFNLGDRDLGTHLVRTERLRRGDPLSAVTADLCAALGVTSRVLPMADGPCRTRIHVPGGDVLPFQEWFVGRRAEPRVERVSWDEDPPAAPGVLEAIGAADLVVIGPSNPYVSIDPVLHRPGVREALRGRPVVAVSPIVGGRAVKGPLAGMVASLAGREASASAIADHYGSLLRALFVAPGDEVVRPGLRAIPGDILLPTPSDRVAFARRLLAEAEAQG